MQGNTSHSTMSASGAAAKRGASPHSSSTRRHTSNKSSEEERASRSQSFTTARQYCAFCKEMQPSSPASAAAGMESEAADSSTCEASSAKVVAPSSAPEKPVMRCTQRAKASPAPYFANASNAAGPPLCSSSRRYPRTTKPPVASSAEAPSSSAASTPSSTSAPDAGAGQHFEKRRTRSFAAKNARIVSSAARTSVESSAFSSSARSDRKSAWKWSAYSSTSASQSPSMSPRARWRYTSMSLTTSPREIRRFTSNMPPSAASTKRTGRANPSPAGITASVAPAPSKPRSAKPSNASSNSPAGSFQITMRRAAADASGCANRAFNCPSTSIFAIWQTPRSTARPSTPNTLATRTRRRQPSQRPSYLIFASTSSNFA